MLDKKIKTHEWSIHVFKSNVPFSDQPQENTRNKPTLQAIDISDVPAEFVADPFLMMQDSRYYLFFEVLNKKTGLGEIGFASSMEGLKWCYQQIVLSEKHHLSYPYVFQWDNEMYMIPESVQAKGVFLYQCRKFPYEWEKVCELIHGEYTDSSIFRYENKWWMFVGSLTGSLHLLYSDQIQSGWTEHPKSPLISGNYHVTRPAGRVIVNEGEVYRFTQDGVPYYGKSVRSFKITKMSETEYEEQELATILSGSNQEGDWKKDGMHHIDQLKLNDDEWLIAVDGHVFRNEYYLKWRMKRFLRSPISDLWKVLNRYKRKEKAIGGG